MASAIRALINKETLGFIRRNTHVSFRYIEDKTSFNEAKILLWEQIDSEVMPTINQARILAKCYRIPFAGLYMNSEDIPVMHLPNLPNFRTMQGGDFDDSAVNLAILDVLKSKALFIESAQELNIPFQRFDLSFTELDVMYMANYFREIMDLTYDTQRRFGSARKLYLYIREKIESHGVYISGFTGVEPSIIRGLAIYDEAMPIIGVNDEDRYPAKSFTILHELVHIMRRSSSMCNEFYDSLSKNTEEIFCNAVAGETLVPRNHLIRIVSEKEFDGIDYDSAEILAKLFSVSKEVIIRRLLDCGIIGDMEYNSLREEMQRNFDNERIKRKHDRETGIKTEIPRNMAREAFDRASMNLSKVLYEGYDAGMFETRDLAHYLGIKEKHINKYLGEVAKWL